MNGDNLYPLGIVLCVIFLFGILLIAWVNYNTYKRKLKPVALFCISAMTCIIGAVFCYKQDDATYKEVYCLRYTIYYPGNTYTYEVDSCNHVYINSDRGTNYLRYYSIPDKETYGIYTSAPIVINKITKK